MGGTTSPLVENLCNSFDFRHPPCIQLSPGHIHLNVLLTLSPKTELIISPGSHAPPSIVPASVNVTTIYQLPKMEIWVIFILSLLCHQQRISPSLIHFISFVALESVTFSLSPLPPTVISHPASCWVFLGHNFTDFPKPLNLFSTSVFLLKCRFTHTARSWYPSGTPQLLRMRLFPRVI